MGLITIVNTSLFVLKTSFFPKILKGFLKKSHFALEKESSKDVKFKK